MRRLIAETINSPAAGSDWSITPSRSEWTRIVNIFGLFTTSATTANRTPTFSIVDSNGITFIKTAFSGPQAASLAYAYNLTPLLGSDLDTGLAPEGIARLVFPDFWLPPLWTVRASTSGIQAGDQWSDLALLAYQTDEQEEAHDFAVIEKAITAQNG